MSGLFSPSNTTATTKSSVQLAPEQQQLIDSASPYIKQFAQNGITLPTGSSVAQFNPTQQAAQQSVVNNAGKQQGGADQALGASNFLLSPTALDPNNNPGLQGAIGAATRPIMDTLTQQTLPAIRSDAVQTGNLGSSRQGIAEGLAATGASNAVGDAAQKTAFSGYQSQLDAMTKALGLTPQTLGAQDIPGQAVGAVGDANQQLQQQLLDEAKQMFLQKQTLPLEIGQSLTNMIGAIPSAGATNVANIPGPSLFQQLLGAGATAAGAYAGATH